MDKDKGFLKGLKDQICRPEFAAEVIKAILITGAAALIQRKLRPR